MFSSNDGSWPHSHYDLLAYYYEKHAQRIASGEYKPFTYPWGALGAFGVIIYMLIPHQNRPWLRKCRFLAFAWIAGFAAYSIIYTRARGMAPGLGVGLLNAWSVVWMSAILVCNDAQTDFQRIERTEGAFGSAQEKEKVKTDRSIEQNNHTPSKPTTEQTDSANARGTLGPRHRHGEFAWQSYPLSPFIERLDFILDIFCNFRGAGWNWRPSALPPPPKWLQEQLQRNSPNPPKHSYRVHPGQVKSYSTRRELLIANAKTAITGYLAMDAIKTFVMHDPYFWGVMDRAPPSYFPIFITYHPVLVDTYRVLVSMLAVKFALQSLFALAPLLFSGLVGPSLIGARAEPWIYPEAWGSYDSVFERGLAGWWSSWWHQTFRFAFEAPSRRIIEKLGMDRKSPVAKVLQLLVAFGLSGVLHACGTYTCPGDTKPMQPLAFFLLQAVGIFAEVGISQALRATGVQRYVPKWLMQAFTFAYVHVWFYYTAHLLCDDFARGGVWLFEPVPVSLFRGLGFGADARDGWWCWGDSSIVSWYSGGWRTGIAF
ncbi:hypothetical protein P153DRAFT_367579 [Dothidotthia symphoricarpi CBS 119687]|uniref:Wax synthase domain-containing protein n=1 Tax=Dothidotthia symphoricarpi CBS 119687 TaxID=1392245 RepID=A0A6A6ACI6_9PLEO|nr:uncharacterized protein P153DRAFT_367579 [Dothidotthia symphoricarpi CBS 119687]KAF2128441.1 hypothetical protein P153DRAFT_367579 [Dothidotthia symphoricarpi CBS 119687]